MAKPSGSRDRYLRAIRRSARSRWSLMISIMAGQNRVFGARAISDAKDGRVGCGDSRASPISRLPLRDDWLHRSYLNLRACSH
jgi:hypothetical protein